MHPLISTAACVDDLQRKHGRRIYKHLTVFDLAELAVGETVILLHLPLSS